MHTQSWQKRSWLAALLMAALLVPGLALADELDEMPVDLALMQADMLANEADEAQFEAESLILASRTPEARELFVQVKSKLIERGDLLIHAVVNAPSKRMKAEAENKLRQNKGWLARTVRTLNTLSVPIADAR